MNFEDPIPGLILAPTDTGIGIVTHLPIRMGQQLYRLRGCPCARPTQHSVQVAAALHIDPEGASWGYINHACTPNLVIDPSTWRFCATRDIAEGEQLRFNYLTTERDLAMPFACRCGADDCVEVVAGHARLDPARRAALQDQVADHLGDLAFALETYRVPGDAEILTTARFRRGAGA